MAEKKGGFHSLEKRIHQIEDEDRAQERNASGEEQRDEKKARNEAPKQEPPKK